MIQILFVFSTPLPAPKRPRAVKRFVPLVKTSVPKKAFARYDKGEVAEDGKITPFTI